MVNLKHNCVWPSKRGQLFAPSIPCCSVWGGDCLIWPFSDKFLLMQQ